MWSKVVICFLVGLAAASQPAFKPNSEYVYDIYGRTLSGISDKSDDYSGIFVKGKLIIRPKDESILTAKLENIEYAEILSFLPDGYETDVPDEELEYKKMKLSEKPFQIITKNGVIEDVVVDSDVDNWEANILRAILSLFQLDVNGENVMESRMNQLPEKGENSGVFKTMEETVTGKIETLYEINPLPEYILQSQPEWLPMPELVHENDEIMEVLKHKNFSHAAQLMSYHYGFSDMGDFEPGTSQMEEFMTRSSFSRAIITGQLKRHIIQSSMTVNKIIISPNFNSEQKAMVVSLMNVTLCELKSASPFSEPSHPQNIGGLVYEYDDAFDEDNKVEGRQRKAVTSTYSSESSSSSSSSEESVQKYNGAAYKRLRRSVGADSSSSSSSSSSDSDEEDNDQYQDQPELNSPPQTPLLPYFIGYEGQSIKESNKIDILKEVRELAQEIAQDLQNPEDIPDQQTLSKFLILVDLTRIMNEQEMKQVANQLFDEKDGLKRDAFKVFRDALAECGTGPALLTIQELIVKRQIRNEEAAQVVAALIESVHEPTQQYMKVLFDLSRSEHVESQWLLNDTIIINYANLIRKVYVDEDDSELEFPIHVFDSFYSRQGREFVSNQYIPHLAKKLDQAVREADSHDILVYIRALGNCGHREILEVFKPYLEGDKQVSQFQRLQMVIALDKLVEVKPEVARSVLYKLYQNTAEEEEIRVACVFLLIRSVPSSSMLQRMAEYTNYDNDEHVNAAVKSVIQDAAELEEEDPDLASKAKAALPLLTSEDYGIGHSHSYIRSNVIDELNVLYKLQGYVIASDDSFYPQGVEYVFQTWLNGAKREWFLVKALVSSVDELTNVFGQQLEATKEEEREKASATASEKSEFSSRKIIEKLQMQFDQREQLEGSILLNLGESDRFFTFNNETIEMLPEVIEELENILKPGAKINYSKLTNNDEITLSFPTEMGLPFVYVHRRGTLSKVSGQIKLQCEPKISDGEQLRVPNKVKVSGQIQITQSSKVESSLSFVLPLNYKEYIAGYDKNVHVYVPLKYNVDIDFEKNALVTEIEVSEPKEDIDIFHYSSHPYIAQSEILELNPVVQSKQYQIIRDDDLDELEVSFGKKQTGMSFKVEYESEEPLNRRYLHQQLHNDDFMSAVLSSSYGENLVYSSFNLTYEGSKSSTSKVEVRVKYFSKEYSEEGRPEKNVNFDQLPSQQDERVKHFAEAAASKIRSAEVLAGELKVKFAGQQNFEYSIGGAECSSPVDKKSRVLLYAEKKSSDSQSKPFKLTLDSKGNTPNTNGLNYQFAKNFDPTTTNDISLTIGESYSNSAKFKINAELSKSEERKQYLDETPEVQQCLRDMKEGNTQLPVCANVTAEANLLDEVSVKVQYSNVDEQIRQYIYSSYRLLNHVFYEYIDENELDISSEEGQLEIEAQFEPDLSALNISIEAKNVDIQINEIPIDNMAKQILVVHPVFSVDDRVIGELYKNQVYHPICTADQKAISTFDNKTYPAHLTSSWSVLFLYVPDYAKHLEVSEEKQREIMQVEEHVILIRGSQQKEVKITARDPETDGRLVEINLKPSEHGQYPKVFVDTEEQHYSEEKAAHACDDYIQVYGLPNHEVKIEVGDDYYVIYDGHRIKITVTDDKFADALKGLCGTYSGDDSTDFTAPENCILEDAEDFIKSYTLGQQSYKPNKKCVPQENNYVSVVSQYDLGVKQPVPKHQGASGSCTKHQTQYKDEGDQVCFSIHPMPVCKSSCKAHSKISKQVKVHCIEKNNVAKLWMEQIDKGANPDFSLKSPHKSIAFEVPQKCEN